MYVLLYLQVLHRSSSCSWYTRQKEISLPPWWSLAGRAAFQRMKSPGFVWFHGLLIKLVIERLEPGALFVIATLPVLWKVYFLVAVWPSHHDGSPLVWGFQSASVEGPQEAVVRSGPRTSRPPSVSNTRRQSSLSARVGRRAEQQTTSDLYLHTAQTPREGGLSRHRCTRRGSQMHTHPHCCRTDQRIVPAPCEWVCQQLNQTSWPLACRIPNPLFYHGSWHPTENKEWNLSTILLRR